MGGTEAQALPHQWLAPLGALAWWGQRLGQREGPVALMQGWVLWRGHELGFCGMSRSAQKQINICRGSWPPRLHAGQQPPHLPPSWARPHLGNCEDPLPTRHHLVPPVMQQVNEAGGLVAADELGQVGGERGVLGESNAIAWGRSRVGLGPGAAPGELCPLCAPSLPAARETRALEVSPSMAKGLPTVSSLQSVSTETS